MIIATSDFKEFIWGPLKVLLILLAAIPKAYLAAYTPRSGHHYPSLDTGLPSVGDAGMENKLACGLHAYEREWEKV